MSVKEYLAQAFTIDSDIEREQLEYIEIEKLFGEHMTDEEKKVLEKYKEAKDKKIALLKQTKLDIMCNISRLQDDKQRDVMFKRYILKKKWDKIAEDMFYDRRQIFRIYNQALRNITIE